MYNICIIYFEKMMFCCVWVFWGEGGGGLVCDVVYLVFSFLLDVKYFLGYRIDKKIFYGVLFLLI